VLYDALSRPGLYPGLAYLGDRAAVGANSKRRDHAADHQHAAAIAEIITVSVAFPAFVLGHDPTRRIICVSYSGDLARKHSNDFRAILDTDWYRTTFSGSCIGQYKNAEAEVALTRHGFRLATSIGGTLTGRSGNFIIVDDPLRPEDTMSEAKRASANERVRTTALSRLDNQRTGAIILVMQRVHMDDMTGSYGNYRTTGQS
jgi:hypothetical protein